MFYNKSLYVIFYFLIIAHVFCKYFFQAINFLVMKNISFFLFIENMKNNICHSNFNYFNKIKSYSKK